MANNPLQPTRVIAIGLSAVMMCTQVLFAHTPELSVWETRQAARRHRAGSSEPSSLLLARLPDVSLSRPAPASARPATIPQDVALNSSAATISTISDILGAVGNAAVVQSIRIPDGRRADAGRPVVAFVQDVHGHLEAQKNIAAFLSRLAGAHPDAVIGLEAAAGPVNARPFRGPRADANRFVADFLLNAGVIAGPEYAALAAPRPVALTGVENPTLYLANVAAVREALAGRRALATDAEAFRSRVAAEAEAAFSPGLRAFAARTDARRAGTLPLGEFLAALKTHAAYGAGDTGELDLFLEALERERRVDAAAVARERSALVTRLSDVLSRRDLAALMSAATAARTGELPAAAFNDALTRAAAAAGLKLATYPNFEAYLAYVALADRLDAERVIAQADAAEARIWTSLCRTDAQRRLVGEREKARLLVKLAALELTTAEWRRYRELGVASAGFATRPFENFYEAAEARNAAIADNLLAGMAADEPVAALVAGGFHKDGLTRRLLERGAAVIVLTPRLADPKSGLAGDYLSVFTRERTPLSEIFESPRISLANTPALAPIDPSVRRNAHVAALAPSLRAAHGVRNALRAQGPAAADPARRPDILSGDPKAIAAAEGATIRLEGDALIADFRSPAHTLILEPADGVTPARAGVTARAGDTSVTVARPVAPLTRPGTYERWKRFPAWFVEIFISLWYESFDRFSPDEFIDGHENQTRWDLRSRLTSTTLMTFAMVALPLGLAHVAASAAGLPRPELWGVLLAAASFIAGDEVRKDAARRELGEMSDLLLKTLTGEEVPLSPPPAMSPVLFAAFVVLSVPAAAGGAVVHFLNNVLSNLTRGLGKRRIPPLTKGPKITDEMIDAAGRLPLYPARRFSPTGPEDDPERADVTYSPDFRFVLTGALVYATGPDRLVSALKGFPLEDRLSGAISADNSTAVVLDEAGTLSAWDIATGDLRGRISGLHEAFRRVQISPDGRHAVLVGAGIAPEVYDLSDGTLIRRVPIDEAYVAAFARTGGGLLVAGNSVSTYLPNPAGIGTRLRTRESEFMAMSPDGSRVFFGSPEYGWDHYVQTQRTDGTGFHEWTLPAAPVDVELSPSGKRIAVLDADGTVHIYGRDDLRRDLEAAPFSFTQDSPPIDTAFLDDDIIVTLDEERRASFHDVSGENPVLIAGVEGNRTKRVYVRIGASDVLVTRRISFMPAASAYRLAVEAGRLTIGGDDRTIDIFLPLALAAGAEEWRRTVREGRTSLTKRSTYERWSRFPDWFVELFISPWYEAKDTFRPLTFLRDHDTPEARAGVGQALGVAFITLSALAVPAVLGYAAASAVGLHLPGAWGIVAGMLSYSAARGRDAAALIAAPAYAGSIVGHFLHSVLSNLSRVLGSYRIFPLTKRGASRPVESLDDLRTRLVATLPTTDRDNQRASFWRPLIEQVCRFGLSDHALPVLEPVIRRFTGERSIAQAAARLYVQAAELAMIRDNVLVARQHVRKASSLVKASDPFASLIRRQYGHIMGIDRPPLDGKRGRTVIDVDNPNLKRRFRLDEEGLRHIMKRHVETRRGRNGNGNGTGLHSAFPKNLSKSDLTRLLRMAMRGAASIQETNPLSGNEAIYHLPAKAAERFGVRRMVVAFDANGVISTIYPTAGDGVRILHRGEWISDRTVNMKPNGSYYWNRWAGKPVYLRWGTKKAGLKAELDDPAGALAPLDSIEREIFLWDALRNGRAIGQTGTDDWYRFDLEGTRWEARLPVAALYVRVSRETFEFQRVTATRPSGLRPPHVHDLPKAERKKVNRVARNDRGPLSRAALDDGRSADEPVGTAVATLAVELDSPRVRHALESAIVDLLEHGRLNADEDALDDLARMFSDFTWDDRIALARLGLELRERHGVFPADPLTLDQLTGALTTGIDRAVFATIVAGGNRFSHLVRGGVSAKQAARAVRRLKRVFGTLDPERMDPAVRAAVDRLNAITVPGAGSTALTTPSAYMAFSAFPEWFVEIFISWWWENTDTFRPFEFVDDHDSDGAWAAGWRAVGTFLLLGGIVTAPFALGFGAAWLLSLEAPAAWGIVLAVLSPLAGRRIAEPGIDRPELRGWEAILVRTEALPSQAGSGIVHFAFNVVSNITRLLGRFRIPALTKGKIPTHDKSGLLKILDEARSGEGKRNYERVIQAIRRDAKALIQIEQAVVDLLESGRVDLTVEATDHIVELLGKKRNPNAQKTLAALAVWMGTNFGIHVAGFQPAGDAPAASAAAPVSLPMEILIDFHAANPQFRSATRHLAADADFASLAALFIHNSMPAARQAFGLAVRNLTRSRQKLWTHFMPRDRRAIKIQKLMNADDEAGVGEILAAHPDAKILKALVALVAADSNFAGKLRRHAETIGLVKAAPAAAVSGPPSFGSLVERRLPPSHRGGWDVPNHNYSEETGRPVLSDHLQGLYDVLNDPRAHDVIPARHQDTLSDPANRDFFELFVLIHDYAKTKMEPAYRRDDAGRIVGVGYAGHEALSVEMALADPVLSDLIDSLGDRRDLFLEVVRLHGSAAGDTPAEVFEGVRSKVRPELDIDQVMAFLIPACFMDVLGVGNKDYAEVSSRRIRRFSDGHDAWRQPPATGGSWLPHKRYAVGFAWIVELAAALMIAGMLPAGTPALASAAVAAAVFYGPHLLIRGLIFGEKGVWRDGNIAVMTALTFGVALYAFSAGFADAGVQVALALHSAFHLGLNIRANRFRIPTVDVVARRVVRTRPIRAGPRDAGLPAGEIVRLRAAAIGMVENARLTIAHEVETNGIQKETKIDASIVTQVDRAVQLGAMREILSAFPDHHLFGEETITAPGSGDLVAHNAANAASDYVWVMDPIDGTRTFAENSDYYAVSLALYYKGKPALAVIYSPRFGWMEVTQNDARPFHNGRPIAAPRRPSPRGIVQGDSAAADRVREALPGAENREHIGSTVVAIAEAVQGTWDFITLLRRRNNNSLWDVAAVTYIAEKAGLPVLAVDNGEARPMLRVIEENLPRPERRHRQFRMIAGTPATADLIAGAARETVQDLIADALPAAYHAGWNVPNHRYDAKAKRVLADHLQAMLDVLNHPESQAAIPAAVVDTLRDPALRAFFERFIVLHDIAKRTMTPEFVMAGDGKRANYPGHERRSHALIAADPALTAGVDRLPALLEAVRLHGDMYQLSKNGVPSDEAFRVFATGIRGDDAEVLRLLEAVGYLDALGSLRPQGTWEAVAGNFSEALERYMARRADMGPATGVRHLALSRGVGDAADTPENQAMFDVLNRPDDFPRIPARYRRLLADPANRRFFEVFILRDASLVDSMGADRALMVGILDRYRGLSGSGPEAGLEALASGMDSEQARRVLPMTLAAAFLNAQAAAGTPEGDRAINRLLRAADAYSFWEVTIADRHEPGHHGAAVDELNARYAGMEPNAVAVAGQPFVKDPDQLEKMSRMFQENNGDNPVAIETDIVDTIIAGFPPAFTRPLRAIVEELLGIVGRGNHYVVDPATYHVNLSVAQDLPLHSGEGAGVLKSRDSRLTADDVRNILDEVRDQVRGLNPFTLVPKGIRMGADGTVVLVFEYAPEVFRFRRELIAGARARVPNYVDGRPKPLIHVTLLRLRSQLTPDAKQARRINQFFAKYRDVGAALPPVPVNGFRFGHETRWMNEAFDLELPLALGADNAGAAAILEEFLISHQWNGVASPMSLFRGPAWYERIVAPLWESAAISLIVFTPVFIWMAMGMAQGVNMGAPLVMAVGFISNALIVAFTSFQAALRFEEMHIARGRVVGAAPIEAHTVGVIFSVLSGLVIVILEAANLMPASLVTVTIAMFGGYLYGHTGMHLFRNNLRPARSAAIDALGRSAALAAANQERLYRRNPAAWRAHIHYSRNKILEGMEQVERRGTATVLGVRSERDIPIVELTSGFNVVNLVDPDRRALRRLVNRIPADAVDARGRRLRDKVRLHVADASAGAAVGLVHRGLLARQWNWWGAPGAERIFRVVTDDAPEVDLDALTGLEADYVISSGVASQTYALAEHAMLSGLPRPAPDREETFRRIGDRVSARFARQHVRVVSALVREGGRAYVADTAAIAPGFELMLESQRRHLAHLVYRRLTDPETLTTIPVSERIVFTSATPSSILAVIHDAIASGEISGERALELALMVADQARHINHHAETRVLPGGLAAHLDADLKPVGPGAGWRWVIDPSRLSARNVEAYLLERSAHRPFIITAHEREGLIHEGQAIADLLADRSFTAAAGEDRVPVDQPFVIRPDLIMVFGVGTEMLAESAADIWLEALKRNPGTRIVFAGGVGRATPPAWVARGHSEAEELAEAFLRRVEAVAPARVAAAKKALITEKNSKDSGQNVLLTLEKLKERKISPRSIMLLHNPLFQLRSAYATWMRQSGLDIPVTSFAPFRVDLERLSNAQLFAAVRFMLGELDRLRGYPEKGFTIPIDTSAVERNEAAILPILETIEHRNVGVPHPDANELIGQATDFGRREAKEIWMPAGADQTGPMSLIPGSDFYEQEIAPRLESPLLAVAVFALPWAFVAFAALAGADLSSPLALYAGGAWTVIGTLLAGPYVADRFRIRHARLGVNVGDGPMTAHLYGLAVSAGVVALALAAYLGGAAPLTLAGFNLAAMAGYAAGHTAAHRRHNILHPRRKVDAAALAAQATRGADLLAGIIDGDGALTVDERRRAGAYLQAATRRLPVQATLVRDGFDFAGTRALVRRGESLEGAISGMRAQKVLAQVSLAAGTADDARALAALMGRQGADWADARAVAGSFARHHNARASTASLWLGWTYGTVSRILSDRRDRSVSVANLADPATLVAFDVGGFLAGAGDGAAEAHLLHRVREFRRHGRGDALIYLGSDGDEAALARALIAIGERNGVAADMNAYLAGSRFIGFGGAAFDPNAVFERSVAELLNVRGADALRAELASRRLALLTGSAERVLLDGAASGIEILLLQAGLRAIPLLKVLENELNSLRLAATNA